MTNKIIIFLLLMINISCNSIKKTKTGKITENESKGIKKVNSNVADKDSSLTIKCDGLTLKPNHDKMINHWQSLLDCLKPKLINGDKEAEKAFIMLIKMDYNFEKQIESLMIMMHAKPRGKPMFEDVLKNSDKFYCYRPILYYSDDERAGTVHTYYLQCYTSMIRTIDGTNVEKYLEKAVPYTYERRIQENNDKCQESLYKDYYTAIKTAYEKGLVVLKDYGED